MSWFMKRWARSRRVRSFRFQSVLPLLAVALGMVAAPGAAEAPSEAEKKPIDIEELSLEDLMNLEVETPTKKPTTVREVPSIVSVITREDIRSWGFNSVGEALTMVPGIYCIDDYLTADCGVRGITGGQRGYSKILKVMIDGQQVSFRSDTTNLLGPQLIPIELVERIEVVRGPVSALYGANAFFGVVNIISRQSRTETKAGARVRVNDDLGVGLSGAFIGGGEWWSATLGASGLYSDYNGRRLPSSSPMFGTFQSADNLESRKAITRDVSAYGNVRLRKGMVEGELSGRYGELDSIAEFLDFGTLTHENRVALRTVDARARANVTPVERLSLTGSLAFASGGPSKDERLSTGAAQTFPRRKFGYDAWDAVLEGRWRIFTDDSLTLGVDWTRDNEDLIEIFTVDRETGQETRTSAEAGRKLFINTGVYAQGIVHPLDVLGVTANVRYDQHNIYGGSTNYRLGAVWTPSERITAKLLYGTSFKAPAALQLYSQPLFPGEVIGNPDLRPETARLLEAEVHWRPVSELAFTVDAFLGRVRDKVELVPTGANLQARNIAHQDGMGLEAEAKWFRGRHILSANAAYQHTDTVVSDVFLGEVSNPSERFPRLSAQLRWQYRHPVWGNLATALRFASQRRASVSNIRDNLLLPYELPAYVSLDLAYYKSWGPHTLQLRLDNLLDTRSAEPGFGGVDLPAWGRHAIISYSFEL